MLSCSRIWKWSHGPSIPMLLARCEDVLLGLQAIVAARRISDFPSVYYHAGITWRLRCHKIAGKYYWVVLLFCPLRAKSYLMCAANANVYCVLPNSAFLSPNPRLVCQLVETWYAVLIQHFTSNFTKKHQKWSLAGVRTKRRNGLGVGRPYLRFI